MRAVIYINGWLLSDTEIADEAVTKAVGGKSLGPGYQATLALLDEHPKPDARPLFLTGRLEPI